MKFRFLAAACAVTMLVGCTKCGQQASETAPTTEAAPTETAPAEMAPAEPTDVEGATAEVMPGSDEMNDELPPEPADQ